jgi:ribose transport system substrate-binding protein
MGVKMKMINKIVSSLLVLLIILMFSFITYNGSKSSDSPETTNIEIQEPVTVTSNTMENVTIGWSVYNSEYEFFATIQEGVFAKASELGINVLAHNQNSNTLEMIKGCTELIELGIDALVISPFNPEAMPIIVNLTKEAGIPVIVIDIGTGGADVDAIIVSDSYGGGILAGEYALKLINEHSLTSTNVAIIKVEETAIYALRRGEAFKSVMEDSGYKIVAEMTANSDTTQAYEAMKNILTAYSDDLAVVFCENDRMALGAAQAIEEAGIKGQIMVIGFDGTPAAIEAIKNGSMQGTIAQQPFEMGELGVELVNTLLTGGTISYDDRITKEIYFEVFLIDEHGEARSRP